MTKLNIGFIGLGNMGGPMAANLIKAGHTVSVFDLNQSVVNELASKGAKAAVDAKQCATNADVLISMLPAGKHVKSLYLGNNDDSGLINGLSNNTLVIDCSTIDAESARIVGSTLGKQGISFVDAPVSGGVAGATAGTLTFIVGGEKAAFDKANTVLSDMGKNIFHAGDIGAGQVAKICNNMLLSILMAGTSEALQMGINNGLDPKVLSDIMTASSGRNWTLELYNPCPGVMDAAPASNDYKPGFMVDLMAKDLGLAMEAAQQSNSSTPMGSMAKNLYTMLQHQGAGSDDFSAIFKLFSK
ncbi:3-hydroxyisobutyrate dehydrogenase [Pseudoalteromonas sp. AS84]|uniref:3-hydroxyisobutyrate dehydrogenase n=1 Tax=Pseudoalteromonas TaxID=53246 RepID=UPI00041034DE|nr:MULTISPECIES: 3-hydroxyisobutyrate dehydrogenase [Pseudoalteromonas]|tara:strand:+ start:13481 stop:14380 length:900 start_codon:yes stop_codon:yes gene_type:complete